MTITNEGKRYEITSGPSREELFDSLRLHQWGIIFRVTNAGDSSEPLMKIEANITLIERSDGSGHGWNIKFYVTSGNRIIPRGTIGEGFYLTNDRKGHAFLS